MRIKGKLLQSGRMLLLTAALCLFTPRTEGAPPLNLGSPVSVSASGNGLKDNGDGNFVGWSTSNRGYEFKLYDKNLNVIKEFAVNVMISVGTPTSVTFVRGADSQEVYYLTNHLFNSDDLYEVLFTSGELYNERGQFLGVLNGNYVYAPDEDNVYVGGSSVIEDVEESQAFIEKYNNSIPAWMTEYDQLGNTRHNDFGASAMFTSFDAGGTDVIGTLSAYNWFTSPQDYAMRNNPKGFVNIDPYQYFYLMVDRSNQLIRDLKGKESSPVKAVLLANAYAVRGWCYLTMAQLYQFTYYGNESKSCVPLVDEFNSQDLTTTGVQRSNVRDTYAFILADLDKALGLLDGNAPQIEEISPEAPRTLASVAALHGLKARAYLIMHRYAEAEAEARSAIAAFDGRPYMKGEIQPGSFTSLDDPSWIWGIRYNDEAQWGMNLVNFTSHMSPFNESGYFMTGNTRTINASLFNNLSGADVRRKLFLDGNSQDDALTQEQSEFLEWQNLKTPYMSVKFGAHRGAWKEASGTGRVLPDYPLMRVEEMYYIVAEAMAMNGDVSGARNYLLSFVNEHRDPGYTVAADVTPAQLRDLIWQQRRIEFWGEGLSYFDLMRLNKGVNRIGGGYPAPHLFNIAPDDNNLLRRFPVQIGNFINVALTEDNNNPLADDPIIYNEEGEAQAEQDYVSYVISDYEFHQDPVTYFFRSSERHSGWKKVTPEIPGVGVVEIHFDPETGTVEVPHQGATAMGESMQMCDTYTFYGSESYANSSHASRRNGRGYDIAFDLVFYVSDNQGMPDVKQHILFQLGTPYTPYVNLNSEDGEYINDKVILHDDSEEVKIIGSLEEGYKGYIGLVKVGSDFSRNSVAQELLKTAPLTGSFVKTQIVTPGNYILGCMVYDSNNNLVNYTLQSLAAIKMPFKNSMEEYGDWGQWKEVGDCSYTFGGLITGTDKCNISLRRNVANPALVNIRIHIGTYELFNGKDLDLIVDLASGWVVSPMRDTGVNVEDYGTIWAADSYTAFQSEYYLGNSRYIFEEKECRIDMLYIIERYPGAPLEESDQVYGTERLSLPDTLENLLSDDYVSTVSNRTGVSQKSFKLNK